MLASRPATPEGQTRSEIQDPQASDTPTLVTDADWTHGKEPRGINRVPTHTVGRARERRSYARARLSLPLRLERIGGQRHTQHCSLQTTNISSSGLFFLLPLRIESGTPIEVEVKLIARPFARATVHMSAIAHVVRTEPTEQAGWYGVAAAFDDISYRRDEDIREPSSI